MQGPENYRGSRVEKLGEGGVGEVRLDHGRIGDAARVQVVLAM